MHLLREGGIGRGHAVKPFIIWWVDAIVLFVPRVPAASFCNFSRIVLEEAFASIKVPTAGGDGVLVGKTQGVKGGMLA